eukprot:17785_1
MTLQRTACHHIHFKTKLDCVSELIFTPTNCDDQLNKLQMSGDNNEQYFNKADIYFKIHLNMCRNCVFIYLSKYCESIRYGCDIHSVIFISSVPMLRAVLSRNHQVLIKKLNIIKFIVKHSNLWRNVIFYASLTIKDFISDKYNMWTYINIMAALNNICRCSIWFKYAHWNTITFETSFIFDLIQFMLKVDVTNSLDAGVDKSKKDYSVEYSFRIIRTWLYYYTKFRLKYKNESLILKYDKQIEAIKKKYKITKRSWNVIKIDKSNIRNQLMSMFGKTRCLRDSCSSIATKNENKKFVKCKQCLVALYCSRRCAKMDWKYGFHKQCCKQIASQRITTFSFVLDRKQI